ncbi:MAG: peroxidase family protein, partial [Verrucomicrobiota bacterium]
SLISTVASSAWSELVAAESFAAMLVLCSVERSGSGLEGAWTATPIKWDNSYFDTLFKYEWELTKSPAGAQQWIPSDPKAANLVPDAHDRSTRHAPIMFTTDLSLRMDPAYAKISKRFHENPDQFAEAFAKAWYKLTHRDMGPTTRYLGSMVPAEPEIWQDPIPAADHEVIDDADIASLKKTIMDSGLTIAQLVRAAWSSASSFRGSDKRGGANGARVRLSPQKDWAANSPEELAQVISALEKIQSDSGKKVSLADLIVLAGCAAVEAAARKGGHEVVVPFSPGRMDATQEHTDVESFAVLEPVADGFRNYIHPEKALRPPEALLVDKAQLLTLTAPEMTVLVGGLRALGANTGGTDFGILTDNPGTLSNDFFVNLLDLNLEWKQSEKCEHFFEGRMRGSDEIRWTGSAVDLVFGSNSQLRALAEVYACDDANETFVGDFVAAWAKVMNLDRFDLA